MTTPTLGSMVHTFFDDYLKVQKGLRPHSVRSYGDAMRLFLQFVSKDLECKITRLSLDDLTAGLVCRFLNSLEEARANSVPSRNQRLAALRAFFEYLGRQLPDRLAQAQQVASIPRKRAQPPETFFLERDEIENIFTAMPSSGRLALRDRALLLFLYNTGPGAGGRRRSSIKRRIPPATPRPPARQGRQVAHLSPLAGNRFRAQTSPG